MKSQSKDEQQTGSVKLGDSEFHENKFKILNALRRNKRRSYVKQCTYVKDLAAFTKFRHCTFKTIRILPFFKM